MIYLAADSGMRPQEYIALPEHALVSLILENGYEAVTIKDICEKADIGRSTFYAHFTGKDDLKRSSLEHLRRLLAARQKQALAKPGNVGEKIMAFCLPLFEHARDHIELYRALAGGPGAPVALGTIRGILSDLVRRELAAGGEKKADAVPREFVAQYIVGACMAVLTWRLDGGAKLPPEQVDAMFRQLSTRGIMSSNT